MDDVGCIQPSKFMLQVADLVGREGKYNAVSLGARHFTLLYPLALQSMYKVRRFNTSSNVEEGKYVVRWRWFVLTMLHIGIFVGHF